MDERVRAYKRAEEYVWAKSGQRAGFAPRVDRARRADGQDAPRALCGSGRGLASRQRAAPSRLTLVRKGRGAVASLFATRAQEPDPVTGAVIPPISLSTTFKQNAPGEPKAGFDYSRSGNPTRDAFEKAVAALEKGKHGTYERECLNSSRGS